MNTRRRIAFYAPLKPPDHPIASGDRQMARMLLSVLDKTGHEAFLASRYISYSKRHGQEHMDARRGGAIAEAERLLAQWGSDGSAPDLWFCYHPYDKSPDWLGIEVCRRLGIPMITAEPCKTGQGPNGEWLPWRAEAQRGIEMAAMNIVMTPSDREYLSTFIPDDKVTWLKPFIDAEMLQVHPFPGDPWAQQPEATKLLTVGMMRPGAKIESYTSLAAALEKLRDRNWNLAICGEGPGRAQVEQLFAWAEPGRVNFLGEVPPEQVLDLMARADWLAWPGCREAYGMVYLEAASRGLPAVAVDNMGVPMVVDPERTGLLAEAIDASAYAKCLDLALKDKALRERLSEGARQFALEERNAVYAASLLKDIVDKVLEEAGA